MEEAKTYLVVFFSNGEMRCTCLVYTPAQLQTFIASAHSFSDVQVMIFEVGPCIYTTVEDTLL
jgi:hypothetical protein